MAILNSIRKRGFFLILIIAMALFAFVLSDVINKGTGGPELVDTVATINGEEISREDFMGKVENYQRSLGPNGNISQAMNVVWNRELRNVLIAQQVEELGITVSEDQLNEALSSSLANNPTFQENGFYSEAAVARYVQSLQPGSVAENQWNTFIEDTRKNIMAANYLTMVQGGLVTTLAESELQYRYENDKINIEYIHMPYDKIADDDVPVSESEIEAYVKANPSQFEVDPLVDIQYVSFLEEASPEDVDVLRAELEELKADLQAATDNQGFVMDNSEVPYSDQWYYSNTLPSDISDTIPSMELGSVFGPYESGNTMRITKLTETKQLPDSVKARHILIPIGYNQTDSISRTREQAQAMADSLETVLRANRSKFVSLVEQYSSDVSSIPNGGTYDFYPYNQMVAEFRDFTFEGNKGDLGVVETQFGFHVIEIEDQKAPVTVYKLATVSKDIEPSEATLSDVFTAGAKFEERAKAGDFSAVAAEDALTPKPVNRIGNMDATIPGIGSNRSIITWAFDEETEVGDIKRFSIAGQYAVVQLTRKSDKKALMSVAEASATVTPILRKEKKAAQIRSSISGTTMADIAASQNVAVKNASAITRSNPTIADAGTEPGVVGAAFGIALGQTTKLIDGENGVYMVKVTHKNDAPALDNYNAYTTQLNASNNTIAGQGVFKALENAAEIEDNRALFY